MFTKHTKCIQQFSLIYKERELLLSLEGTFTASHPGGY